MQESIGGNLSGGYLPGVLDELAIYNGMAFPVLRIAQLHQSAVSLWPALPLPQIFDQPQYGEWPVDLFSRFYTVYGPPKSRPGVSGSYTSVRGIIQITDSDKNTLETFYTDSLKGGAISFEAQLLGESTPTIYRFVDPPAFHDLAGSELEEGLNLLPLP